MHKATEYKRNRETVLNRAKDYYKNNKEKLREKTRNNYRELPEKDENIIREYGRSKYMS